MFRKTVKIYKRRVDSYSGRKAKLDSISKTIETIGKTTYWFLFIPIYTKYEIISSSR